MGARVAEQETRRLRPQPKGRGESQGTQTEIASRGCELCAAGSGTHRTGWSRKLHDNTGMRGRRNEESWGTGGCVCLKTSEHAVSDALAEAGASLMKRGTLVIESQCYFLGSFR